MSQLMRWEALQALIDRYSFSSYLEIGAAGGKTFRRIRCPRKAGIDVRGGAATFRGTSNEFWHINCEHYDLVFIDGWHQAEQVDVDVQCALQYLTWRGLVMLHDCNPRNETRQQHEPTISGGWNGDVWKSYVRLRQRQGLDCACGDFDQGCGFVVQRQTADPLDRIPDVDLMWQNLEANRARWLRLMDWEAVLEWLGDR